MFEHATRYSRVSQMLYGEINEFDAVIGPLDICLTRSRDRNDRIISRNSVISL
jgi:hypothetical protein